MSDARPCNFCGKSNFKSDQGTQVHENKYCTKNPACKKYIPPVEETPADPEPEIEPEQEAEEPHPNSQPPDPSPPEAPPQPSPVEKVGGGSTPAAPITEPSPPIKEEPDNREKKDSTGTIVIAIVVICIIVAVIVAVWYFFIRKKPCAPCKDSQRSPEPQEFIDQTPDPYAIPDPRGDHNE